MKAETLVVFFVAAIFSHHQKNVYGFNQNRIINGTDTPPGVFEFLPELVTLSSLKASIFISGCSSTIISKRHILTAAHCVFAGAPENKFLEKEDQIQAFLVDYRPKNNDVYGNQGTPFYRLKDYNIQTKIFVHPEYTPIPYYSVDNAIIEFPEGTNLNITPITLISDFVEKDGEKAIAAGYGMYKHQGIKSNLFPIDPQFPKVLQNVTVDLHTPENCKDAQRREELICTGTADYRAAPGDSGGPLMIERNGNYYQIGVFSIYSINNAFYARLSRTCGWITEVTKGEVNCQTLSSISPTQSPAPQPANTEAQQSPSNANVSFVFNILSYLFVSFSLFNF